MKIIFPYIEIEQPIGTFYMSTINAEVLAQIVSIQRRNEKEKQNLFGNNRLPKDEEGVQREQSKERVESISKYCQDPDATFPTPIIISIYRDKEYTDNGHEFIFDIDEYDTIGDVIDGQHRLLGIMKSKRAVDFNLPVVLMFNLTMEEKAYVFSIINSTQTKVSMSLIYDLFDLSKTRSFQKTAHEIARSLNKMNNSPFFNRLKMLGKKDDNQYYATLSQGTFVTQLLSLMTKDPNGERSALKRNKPLPKDEHLPLRQYFLEGKDDVILKIILNCFSALKIIFPDEWKNPDRNILWKTTGFGGVIKAFPKIYKYGIVENDLSQSFFEKIFASFKEYMQVNNKDFTSKFYSGGGEQLQGKLCQDILRANNL